MKAFLIFVVCAIGCIANGALFKGNARVDIQDPSGGLSWDDTAESKVLTVSCWFKFVIPSGTNITQNMTVLVDRTTGADTNNSRYAYLIRYNIYKGALEACGRGPSGAFTNTLIDRPYLDRWYHVAVVRQGDEFTGYLDGRQVFSGSRSTGSSSNDNGVCIGAWGNANYFWGEIQEVAIYRAALSQEFITEYMFKDQPALPELKGYYKLAWSANEADYYRNFAPNPPAGTEFGFKQGAGQVVFEEVNEGGEQSLFDSYKNGGGSVIVPLSGAFAWQQTAFTRPTPGIGFAFNYGYNSGDSFSGYKIGSFDPYEFSILGRGWRHSLDVRLIPGQYFSPVGGLDILGLMTWNGAIETWVLDLDTGLYKTRHGEYRGELTMESTTCTWTTPERLKYRFRHPFLGSTIMRGRLMDVSDFNTNKLSLLWNETLGIVTQFIDSSGGRYNLRYNAQYLLTNLTFQGWTVDFQYDASNRLSAKWLSGPSAYSNVNTRWVFQYYTNNLLSKIIDPASNQALLVTYDQFGRQTNVVDAIGRRVTTEYTVAGDRKLIRTDPENLQWTEYYDRKGRITCRMNPLGHITSNVFDDAGNVIRVTDPMGRTTSYGYDERANRIVQTNALGQVSRTVYHHFFNKPVESVDPLGWSTRWEYNAGGNVISNWDALGLIAANTYKTSGLVETSSDANGNVTRFSHNADGFLVSKTDSASNTWSYTPNELNWILTEINPLGQQAVNSYDVNGKVLLLQDPLSRTFIKTYDANGNLLSESDGKDGAEKRYTYYSYDAANQMTQKVDRSGAIWRTVYTPRGKASIEINPLGHSISNTYDAASRLVGVTDPLGNAVVYEYDSNNNQTGTIDKLGRRWRKEYDALNRVVREMDPLTNVVQTLFDEAGRIVSTISARGYAATNFYDGRGRLIRRIDAEGYEWVYDQDGNGNVTNITDALGGHYVMTYGPRNERLTERNQDGNEWIYVYDELLRLSRQIDPNGRVREIAYDAGGRIDYVLFSPSSRADDYTYDLNNNLTALSRAGGGAPLSASFQYDEMDRLTRYADPYSKIINYSYDPLGRVAARLYPDGKAVSNVYDQLSRLVRQTDWASRQMIYVYDKADRLVSRTYPNGIVQTNVFDHAGRLTRLGYANPAGQLLADLSYGYDPNGNKIASRELHTLKWPDPDPMSQTARYTPAGKLIDRVDADNPNNDFAYEYDPAGNMTNAIGADQSYALVYDDDNRITAIRWITDTTTRQIVNRYDAFGRRISRTKDGIEARYVLDLAGTLDRILCDASSAGAIQNYYVHGPDLCYKVTADGMPLYYHADPMGNIIFTTDSNANKVSEYAYTPYGKSLAIIGDSGDPYRFVGSQGVMEDFPGLYFMRARYYSADGGVFLSTDPVKKIGPGWRPVPYAYANDNPLVYGDPKGDIAFTMISALISVADVLVKMACRDLKHEDLAQAGTSIGVGVIGDLTAGAPIWGAGAAAGIKYFFVGTSVAGDSFGYDNIYSSGYIADWHDRRGVAGGLRGWTEFIESIRQLYGDKYVMRQASSLLTMYRMHSVSANYKQHSTGLSPATQAPKESTKKRSGTLADDTVESYFEGRDLEYQRAWYAMMWKVTGELAESRARVDRRQQGGGSGGGGGNADSPNNWWDTARDVL